MKLLAQVLKVNITLKGTYIIQIRRREHRQIESLLLTEAVWHLSPVHPLSTYSFEIERSDKGLLIKSIEKIKSSAEEFILATKTILSEASPILSKRYYDNSSIKDILDLDFSTNEKITPTNATSLTNWAKTTWRKHKRDIELGTKLAQLGFSYIHMRWYLEAYPESSNSDLQPHTILPFLNDERIATYVREARGDAGQLQLLAILLDKYRSGKTLVHHQELPVAMIRIIPQCVSKGWLISSQNFVQLASCGIIDLKIRDFFSLQAKVFHPSYSPSEIDKALFRWQVIKESAKILLERNIYLDLYRQKTIIWFTLNAETIPDKIKGYLAAHKILARTPVTIIALSEHIYHDPHLNALDIPIIRPCSTVPSGYSTCIILGAEAASIMQFYRLTKSLTPYTKVIFIINTPKPLLKDNPVKSLVDYYPNINSETFDFTDIAPSELVDVVDFLELLTENDTQPIITDTHKLAKKINALYMKKTKENIIFVDDKSFAINDLVKIEFTSGNLSGSLIHGRLCSVSRNKVLIEHNGKFHMISENDALQGKWSPGYAIHISELPRLRLGRFQALFSEASYDIELTRYISELRLESSAISVHWYSENPSYSEEFQIHPRLVPIIE